jgi:hypothetical protein
MYMNYVERNILSGVIACCFQLEFGRREMANSELIGLLKRIATTQYLLV